MGRVPPVTDPPKSGDTTVALHHVDCPPAWTDSPLGSQWAVRQSVQMDQNAEGAPVAGSAGPLAVSAQEEPARWPRRGSIRSLGRCRETRLAGSRGRPRRGLCLGLALLDLR